MGRVVVQGAGYCEAEFGNNAEGEEGKGVFEGCEECCACC